MCHIFVKHFGYIKFHRMEEIASSDALVTFSDTLLFIGGHFKRSRNCESSETDWERVPGESETGRWHHA